MDVLLEGSMATAHELHIGLVSSDAPVAVGGASTESECVESGEIRSWEKKRRTSRQGDGYGSNE